MLKIIHSKFEIDLSNNSDVSINEENSWFSDRFFIKFSLPFEFTITNEINAALGDILSYDSSNIDTLIDVKFVHAGKFYDATLEIEDIIGKIASATIKFGFEELPNFNAKLSELPLDDFELQNGTNIYDYAQAVKNQTWPDVSHNFTMVHTEKLDTDSDQWAAFEGTLNKTDQNGDFIENEFDAENNVQYNRNVMQPQPYLLHVIKKGFQDAGLNIDGDFLTHPKIKKSLISEISSYYTTINTNSEEFTVNAQEHILIDQYGRGWYHKPFIITEPGRYKIAGNIELSAHIYGAYSYLKFNGNTLSYLALTGLFIENESQSYSIDVNIDFFGGPPIELVFYGKIHPQKLVDGVWVDDFLVCDLTITQISLLDNSGNFLPSLILPTEIKLKHCVPKMTFGELLTTIKNWFNIEFSLIDDTVYINFIQKELNHLIPLNLEDYMIREPKRIPQVGKTFLLKFQDIDSEEYSFEEIFYSKDGVVTSNFTTEDDTDEIIINALPLPLKMKSGILTADHFFDDDSKLSIILYDGTTSNTNSAEETTELLMPTIFDENYKNWLDLRINSQSYEWDFKLTEEQLQALNFKTFLIGYNKQHIIKTIEKDLIKDGYWYVEVETETKTLRQFIE